MIKTTVVGSYPVPQWLQICGNRDTLRDAMLVVLKTQELAGIDVVADGELYRWDVNHAETNGMIDYFVRPLEGIQTDLKTRELTRWREQPGMSYRSQPAGLVHGPLAPGFLNLRRDYELYRNLTDRPKKFTVTSPYMLAKVLWDEHYGDLRELVLALGDVIAEQVREIDAQVIQVDEANITGHADDGQIAADGINRILQAVQGDSAVHLCFGNYGGQTIQQGTYDKLVDFLNRLQADHLILEMARRPDAELEMLREVRDDLGLGIGVIDIKDNEVESPETVARRIEAAALALGAERIQYVHPDFGFWMLPRSVADAKMHNLVAGRNLFAGQTS